jgi:2-polyprenyl-3-methyl-5-hydroxy-6-metoxy-1,4-benzoquinol methylase
MNYKIDHCEPFDNKIENPWMKAEHVGRYLFAVDFFKNENAKKIIDVACAEGFGSKLLSENGFSVFGADINSEYIKTSKQRCNGVFAVVDFEKQDFPKDFENADGGVCFETIEHLKTSENLLKNLHSHIKKGKCLLLSFPNATFEKVDENGVNYDPYHLRIYTKEEIKNLVQSVGFVLEEEYGQTLCNDLYSAESDARHSSRLTQKEINEIFRYDEESIKKLAKLIGYPTQKNISETYSFLWVLRKV